MAFEELVYLLFSLAIIGRRVGSVLSVGCVDLFEVLVVPEFVIVLVASTVAEVRVLLVELILVKRVQVVEVKFDLLVVEAALFLSVLEWKLVLAVIDLVIRWSPVDFCIAIVLYLVLVSLSIRRLSNLRVRLLHIL